MSRAIFGFDCLIVIAAVAMREREVGQSKVGAIKDDDLFLRT